MPELSASGMALFIAEIRADSVLSVLDVNEGLSGSFDIRHKIGASELEKKLEVCCKTFSGSHERVISILHLLAFASAAYTLKDIGEMLATSRDQLRKLKVNPQHGGSAILELACKNEPMNLWLGYAVENRRSNKLPFDPNKVSWINDPKGKPYQQMLPSSGMKFKDPTTSENLLKAAAPKSEAYLLGNKTPPAKKNVSIITTPMSIVLKENIPLLKSNVVSVSYFETTDVDKTIFASEELIAKIGAIKNKTDLLQVNLEIEEFICKMELGFSEIINFIGDSTIAGNKHYDRLIDGLIYRKMEKSDDFKVIQKCAMIWGKNRIELLAFAKKYLESFKQRKRKLSFNDVSGEVEIPKKFALTKI